MMIRSIFSAIAFILICQSVIGQEVKKNSQGFYSDWKPDSRISKWNRINSAKTESSKKAYNVIMSTMSFKDWWFLDSDRPDRNEANEDCLKVIQLTEALEKNLKKLSPGSETTMQSITSQSVLDNYLRDEFITYKFIEKCKAHPDKWQNQVTNITPNEQAEDAIPQQFPNARSYYDEAVLSWANSFPDNTYLKSIGLRRVAAGNEIEINSGIRLKVNSGNVYIDRYGKGNFLAVSSDAGVNAVLKYTDGTVLNLKTKSALYIDGDVVYIARGKANVRVTKRGSEFLIKTPTAAVGIRGTVFDITHENGFSTVELYEGSVEVKNDNSSLILQAGEKCIISSKTGPVKRLKLESDNTTTNTAIEIPEKIPYNLPVAKWVERNTIDGFYQTEVFSSALDYLCYVTGRISSSMFSPNVTRFYNQGTAKSRESHNLGRDALGGFALDSKHMWVCGSGGVIGFNSNTALGSFWKAQTSGTTQNLNSIFFTDENFGWAVGDRGTALFTHNGGNTWQIKPGLTDRNFVDVQFVDRNHGWILCDASWYPAEMPLIIITRDGGITWKSLAYPAGVDNNRMNINAMWFTDNNTGWIVGANSLIMKTMDGGDSWKFIQKPVKGNIEYTDIQFTDPWNGYICGDNGTLLHTKDGGITWENESFGETEKFFSIHFNSPYYGWVVTNKKLYEFFDEKGYRDYYNKMKQGKWITWGSSSSSTAVPTNSNISATEQPEQKTVQTNQEQKSQTSNNNVSNSNDIAGVLGTIFVDYRLNDPSISSQLEKEMNQSFTPIGMNITGNNLRVMYLNQDPFKKTAWAIDWYTDADGISKGITTKMQNEGFFPMGIASDNSKLYGLFIKGETNASAWQLVESKVDLKEVAKNIDPYLSQGYIPVGITLHGDNYYSLLVKVEGGTFKNWEIIGYQNKAAMDQDILNKFKQNKIPFGYLESKGVTNILYVGW